MLKKLFYLMLMPLAMSVVSCDKEDDSIINGGVTPNEPQEVSFTTSADVQSYHSVVLKGTVNGTKDKVGFCYSETEQNPTPDNAIVVETKTINSDKSFECTVDGLMPATTYYYRAFATKDNEVVLAKEVNNFTTEELMKNNGHEYVDLGITSNGKPLYWAICNVGATKPEEYGDYFVWGETEPYYTEGHSQDEFCVDWKSGKDDGYWWWCYQHCRNGSWASIIKYCNEDKKSVLDPEDDTAAQNWGGDWRMPTLAELDLLCTECYWEETEDYNGVCGITIVGPSGNSIFLPSAGWRYGHNFEDAGGYGFYWSSNLDRGQNFNAYGYYFGNCVFHWFKQERCRGYSVRAVCQ